MINYVNDETEKGRFLEQQIKNYISFGFHKYLKMTETEYMNSVSANVIQPEEYKGIFDLPVFVEARIPIKEQLKLLRIDDYINAANLSHLTEEINFPYVVWTNGLSAHAGKTILETHSNYLEIETGCLYGVFIWIVMTQVVLPLSNTPKIPFNMIQAIIGINILMIAVGIPISIIIGNYYAKSQS